MVQKNNKNAEVMNNFFIEICEKIVEDKVNLIEGCREIVSLSENIHADVGIDFTIFKGVASETDYYPDENVRMHFNKKYLQEIEKKTNDYVNIIRPFVVEECKKTISLIRSKLDDPG